MQIVFLTHTSTRTGAPLLLLKLIAWTRQHLTEDIIIINRETEILDEEFVRHGTLLSFDLPFRLRSNPTVQTLPTFLKNAVDRVSSRYIKFRIQQVLGKSSARVVVSNTLASNDLLHFVQEITGEATPSVVYVHELAYATATLSTYSSDWNLPTSLGDAFLGCSAAVVEHLQQLPGIGERPILQLNSFLLNPPRAEAGIEADATDQLRILPAAAAIKIVVGAIGIPSWRKGFDLFLLLAKALAEDDRFHFAWLGKEEHTRSNTEYEEDLRKLSLANFSWIANQESSEALLRQCSIFALISREDPFPLVSLEALALGKPVVCFAKAGGAPELVGEGGGRVVTYGNVPAFRDAVVDLAVQHTLEVVSEQATASAAHDFADAAGEQRLELFFRALAQGVPVAEAAQHYQAQSHDQVTIAQTLPNLA